MPGVVNRTFGNRTQSNPIARLGSVTELNRTHKKILPIKRNRTVQQSNIERFSYDLEMFMCEQNANNRLNEHTQTRAGFDWSCEHAMFSSELKVIIIIK